MFPAWESATQCTSGPQPGTMALARWILENFGDEGAYNLGIYNCRTVRGGSTTSLHGEGRAFDAGFPVGDPDGDELVKLLLKATGRLGIQAIIYERRIYSALSPKGRYYGGVNPHRDHLHIEQTRESAANLTYATVDRVLTNRMIGRFKPGTRILFEGMTGTDVRFVQRKLNMRTTDGIFGPKTKSRVQRFEENQKKRYPRMRADGVVGAITWKALGVTPSV
jgi:peptidoglycan hydrolase-like protein with peptidoglycan-binding domain